MEPIIEGVVDDEVRTCVTLALFKRLTSWKRQDAVRKVNTLQDAVQKANTLKKTRQNITTCSVHVRRGMLHCAAQIEMPMAQVSRTGELCKNSFSGCSWVLLGLCWGVFTRELFSLTDTFSLEAILEWWSYSFVSTRNTAQKPRMMRC